MQTGDIIRSCFEFILIVITIIAMIKEPQIARFERKVFRACKIHFHKHRSQKNGADCCGSVHSGNGKSIRNRFGFFSVPIFGGRAA